MEMDSSREISNSPVNNGRCQFEIARQNEIWNNTYIRENNVGRMFFSCFLWWKIRKNACGVLFKNISGTVTEVSSYFQPLIMEMYGSQEIPQLKQRTFLT